MLRINLGLIEWAGGVAFGSGAVIGGQPLDGLGVMTKYPRQALDMTAEAIARGQPVPQSRRNGSKITFADLAGSTSPQRGDVAAIASGGCAQELSRQAVCRIKAGPPEFQKPRRPLDSGSRPKLFPILLADHPDHLSPRLGRRGQAAARLHPLANHVEILQPW